MSAELRFDCGGNWRPAWRVAWRVLISEFFERLRKLQEIMDTPGYSRESCIFAVAHFHGSVAMAYDLGKISKWQSKRLHALADGIFNPWDTDNTYLDQDMRD